MTLRYSRHHSGQVLGADSLAPSEERAMAAWRAASDGHFIRYREAHLLAAQAGVCYLCAETFDLEPVGRCTNLRAHSEDHVFPRVTGGRGYSNILYAHRDCNSTKGPRWPYPCEVIYLAAVYAAPFDAPRVRAERRQAMLDRNDRRRAALERMHA